MFFNGFARDTDTCMMMMIIILDDPFSRSLVVRGDFPLPQSIILERLHRLPRVDGGRERIVQAKLPRKNIFHHMDRMFDAVGITVPV